MKQKFLSFSKRLSRRILMAMAVTISVVALMVLTFAGMVLDSMSTSYFLSLLQMTNEAIEQTCYATDPGDTDEFYLQMRAIDVKLNELNPLLTGDGGEKDNRGVWTYDIVIDSLGNYIYHPDRQRILRGSLFGDIGQSTDEQRQELALGLASGKKGHQEININGVPSYIYYTRLKNRHYSNAIIQPSQGLLIPTSITLLGFFLLLALGLYVTYTISRITIRRSTQPLQYLAKSADEVAKGNFHSPLPELKYNDEISQLRDSFGNMQQSLTQYIDQLKATTAQKAAIESELNIARDIQLSTVPTQFPIFPTRPDFDIYASITPAKAVGGDPYDFFVRDNQLFFCIGDVSGKGIPAALLMMVTSSLFRSYASSEDSPEKIVSKINYDVNKNNKELMFITLFVGVLDLKTGLLRYCNAGHEAPIVIGKEVSQLPVQRIFPVGIMANTPYEMQTAVLEPQTTLLLYTDGLNEATSDDKAFFGLERVLDEVNRANEAGQLTPKTLIEDMTEAVHDFVGDAEQSDDLTMLALKFIGI